MYPTFQMSVRYILTIRKNAFYRRLLCIFRVLNQYSHDEVSLQKKNRHTFNYEYIFISQE
jgi:hypothetical protein